MRILLNPLQPLSSRPRLARWLTVAAYATAMAWVEAAVVFYLRTMINRIEPYQPNPFPAIGGFGSVELVRELATLVMLFTVGLLAGRTWRSRLGYAAIAFGVWDIFYYAFLKAMCDWPHSLLSWDILFLIPLPWWGPVLAPVSIALLLIAWGTLASQSIAPNPNRPESWKAWALNFVGIVLALYVFMADTLRVADRGLAAVCTVLPEKFNWPLFCVALGLMSAPVAERLRYLRGGQQERLAAMDWSPSGRSSTVPQIATHGSPSSLREKGRGLSGERTASDQTSCATRSSGFSSEKQA